MSLFHLYWDVPGARRNLGGPLDIVKCILKARREWVSLMHWPSALLSSPDFNVISNHRLFSVCVCLCVCVCVCSSTSTSNTVFKETLKQIEGSGDCGGLPMISFLILPMQRVTRLPLLLDVSTHSLQYTHRPLTDPLAHHNPPDPVFIPVSTHTDPFENSRDCTSLLLPFY